MNVSHQSQLAHRLLLFCRLLRRAGLAIGPGRVLDAMRAVAATGISREDDFRAALRAVLVSSPSQHPLFDRAFGLCFTDSRLHEQAVSAHLPADLDEPHGAAAGDLVRVAALRLEADTDSANETSREGHRVSAWSGKEVFKNKDFEQMTAEELQDARRLLREYRHPARRQRTRRFRPGATGHQFDLRRSMRNLLRYDGELLQLARRRHEDREQALVLLCDISGSMSCYSRTFLHYAHTLATHHRNVHVFVFGTRLSNITRWLRTSDVDVALQRVSLQVPDWDGGTRIAESLHQFNRHWGRRVLAGGATVVLLSDGLERDDVAALEFEMQRLNRSCRELIWMNPMLRFSEFEPRASGIRAMLPHVHRFVAAHSIASILELGRLVSAKRTQGKQTAMDRAS